MKEKQSLAGWAAQDLFLPEGQQCICCSPYSPQFQSGFYRRKCLSAELVLNLSAADTPTKGAAVENCAAAVM